jgi:ribosomal protein L19E
LFTNDVLQEYLLIMRADEIEVEAKRGQVPTKPDPLRSEKEWFRFWEKLKNYLGRVRGAAKIPLSYVVRDHDEPTAAMRTAEYGSHSKKVTALTLLSGQHFTVDNESVWEVTKTLVIDGFGWSFVKRFDRTMDGRSAIKALRRQCEGKTSIKTRKNKAYASIAGSRYKGVRKQFTFSQYVAIHQAAHNELEDCNEPMPETKKVSDFLAGISDSALDSGITCVLSDDRYSDDFEATQQFLGTLVANQIVHRQGKRGGDEERNASSIEANSKGAKKNNGKGKTKKRIEARFYDNEEWSKLTSEERAQVVELKKQKKENKNKSKGSNKRKTASTESTEREEEASGNEENGDAASDAQAGNEFGRGAHKKKKVTISAAARVEPTRTTQRHVMMARSTFRYVMDTSQSQGAEGRSELDTHADTCVAGSNTVVLDLTGNKTVSVAPFCESEFDPMKDVPIATVATAYDCPMTGRTYVLVINEAIYLGGKMDHTLLCPNQLRPNGLRVNDCPKQFDATSDHSIHVPESNFVIPLSMRGVISGFHTRVPTAQELEDLSIHVELTSETEWDPYSMTFEDVESTTELSQVENRSNMEISRSPTYGNATFDLVEFLVSERNDMAARLVSAMRIRRDADLEIDELSKRRTDAVVRNDDRRLITPEEVSQRWHVGLGAATQTLQVTTQLCVRTLKHPA